jgi:hypothetical protein
LRAAILFHGFNRGALFHKLFGLTKFAATLGVDLNQGFHAAHLSFAELFQTHPPPTEEFQYRFFHQPALFFCRFTQGPGIDGALQIFWAEVLPANPAFGQGRSLLMLQSYLLRTSRGHLPRQLSRSFNLQTRLFFRQLPDPQDAP